MAVLSNSNKESFCLSYIEYGCDRKKWKEILEDVGYRENRGYFNRLLNEPLVQGRLLEIQELAADKAVMNLRERLEMFSKIARDEEAPVSQRISAANALHKQSGDEVATVSSDSANDGNTTNVLRMVDLKLPAKIHNKKKKEASGGEGIAEELNKLDNMYKADTEESQKKIS